MEGKFLLAKRAADKHPFPGLWCCAVGGKVLAGESYHHAALREMQEELGLPAELQFVASFTYNQRDYQGIFQVFTTKDNLDLNRAKIDAREIDFLHAFELGEIKALIEKTPEAFAPTFLVALEVFAQQLQNNRKQ